MFPSKSFAQIVRRVARFAFFDKCRVSRDSRIRRNGPTGGTVSAKGILIVRVKFCQLILVVSR